MWLRIILAFLISPIAALIISSSLALYWFSVKEESGFISYDLLGLFVPAPLFLLSRYLLGWSLVSCVASGVVAYCGPLIWHSVSGSAQVAAANSGLTHQLMLWSASILTGLTYGVVFWLIASFRTR
jgi:hypothetical protein